MGGKTGSVMYSKYGWETAFKDGATTKNKIFGMNTKYGTASVSHNIDKLYQLGSPEVQKFVWKQFEGAISTEFVLANPWFLKAVFGSVVDAGGSAPYTHTFTRSNTAVSMGIELAGAFANENVVKTYKGCVVSSMTLATAINDFANVRLDLLVGDVALDTTLSEPVVETFTPYTYAHGTLEMPTGSTLAEVQTAEITIAPNPQMLYQVGGSYTPVQFARKEFAISGRFSLNVLDADMFDLVVGRAEVATGTLTFTMGSGASTQEVKFSITGIGLGEHSVPADVNEIIVEELPFVARQISCVAKDATATTP